MDGTLKGKAATRTALQTLRHSTRALSHQCKKKITQSYNRGLLKISECYVELCYQYLTGYIQSLHLNSCC